MNVAHKPQPTGDELDEVMSEIGLRRINVVLGRPIDDDDTDDMLAERLIGATSDQRLEVVDCLIDTIAVATMVRTAMSDGQELDAQEITDLLSHLYEIEQDAILVTEELAK